jgi:hypothetical protein
VRELRKGVIIQIKSTLTLLYKRRELKTERKDKINRMRRIAFSPLEKGESRGFKNSEENSPYFGFWFAYAA